MTQDKIKKRKKIDANVIVNEEEEMKARDAEVAKNVGRKIRFFRQLKGLSQSDIAVHLGITFQQFQKYESGKNRIPVSRLMKLADIFGVKMAIFFENTVNVMFEDMMKTKANRLNEEYTPLEFSSQVEAVNIAPSNSFGDEDVTTLVKHFRSIQAPEVRQNILLLVKNFAETNGVKS